MALAESHMLMHAFVSIPSREGRVTAVNFARMLMAPGR